MDSRGESQRRTESRGERRRRAGGLVADGQANGITASALVWKNRLPLPLCVCCPSPTTQIQGPGPESLPVHRPASASAIPKRRGTSRCLSRCPVSREMCPLCYPQTPSQSVHGSAGQDSGGVILVLSFFVSSSSSSDALPLALSLWVP